MGIRATIHAIRPGTDLTGPILESLELDKAWYGIHFLLSGSRDGGSEIEKFLLSGDQSADVADADVFHHSSHEVAAFAELLRQSPSSRLRERFDPDRMDALNIYPASAGDAWDEIGLDFLIGHYERLREFVSRQAAEANELLVVFC